MKPLALPLFADENIHPNVVGGLRERGVDVVTVPEEGLRGSDDATILRRAFATQRVVVTHDSDFGRLAIDAGEPYFGILFVRPGHISPAFEQVRVRVRS